MGLASVVAKPVGRSTRLVLPPRWRPLKCSIFAYFLIVPPTYRLLPNQSLRYPNTKDTGGRLSSSRITNEAPSAGWSCRSQASSPRSLLLPISILSAYHVPIVRWHPIAAPMKRFPFPMYTRFPRSEDGRSWLMIHTSHSLKGLGVSFANPAGPPDNAPYRLFLTLHIYEGKDHCSPSD